MKARLHIQDPRATDLPYAIDLLASAAEGATGGRAVFAFATVAGVDLLFSVDSVRRLASRGKFQLIVGLDAITNKQTLQLLLRYSRAFPGLTPRVFWNLSSGLFHLKLCHFWNVRRESWIVGSGNLTPRGLRDSYEAFSVIEAPPEEMRTINSAFDGFLCRNAAHIREIDNEALKRAAKNRFSNPVADVEPPQAKAGRAVGSEASAHVLVAELPRGGSRWQQANFNRVTAREFFGVDPDGSSTSWQKDLSLSELDGVGRSVREDWRRFTFTRSKNLRLQLAAKSGQPYPAGARPIAVFREVKARHFVYQLLLPGDSGFAPLRALVARHRKGKIARVSISLGEMRRIWSGCPLV